VFLRALLEHHSENRTEPTEPSRFADAGTPTKAWQGHVDEVLPSQWPGSAGERREVFGLLIGVLGRQGPDHLARCASMLVEITGKPDRIPR
jgi:hypothetical protein